MTYTRFTDKRAALYHKNQNTWCSDLMKAYTGIKEYFIRKKIKITTVYYCKKLGLYL